MDRITWIFSNNYLDILDDVQKWLNENGYELQGFILKENCKLGFSCNIDEFRKNGVEKLLDYKNANTISITYYNFEKNIREKLYKKID